MKKLLGLLLIFSFFTPVFSQKLSQSAIIPLPQKITDKPGYFQINSQTKIFIPQEDNCLYNEAFFLQKLLSNAGYNIPVTRVKPGRNYIQLSIKRQYDAQLGTEGYILSISPEKIEISANTPDGIFYAIQTLRQIMPPQVEKQNPEPITLKIPAGEIKDWPLYEYRSMMLDVARHFFPPQDIKTLIDELSLFKINHLHLHLADDQGWRIEIKAFPELTQTGGKTQVGGGKGGYYTQEEFRDIVKYAAERHIEIVPEIDMPGHTNAALASYAFLNCDGKKRQLYTGTRVGFSSLCTTKDSVYWFVDKVIGEIAALYPGKYFHTGADESHSTPHEEYLRFIDSVQRIIAKHGKVMIGWDEIAQTKLLPTTIVQFWSYPEHVKMAQDQGNKFIFSFAPYCYMDMKYNPQTKLGLKWAGYIEIDKSYNWRPDTVKGLRPGDIIGIEAPLWTETVKTLADIQYMTFPRICSYAEIGWTAPDKRNWDNYKNRLAAFAPRFELLGINFYKSPQIPWKK